MKSRRILVIGAGYVGLVTAACLADIGHQVVCLDINEERIEMLKQGRVPIYEPGLDEVLFRNLGKRLGFTTDYADGLPQAEVVLVAVGTPSDENGDADLTYVWQVIHSLAERIDRPMVIAIKSTVPVGTCDSIAEYLNAVIAERFAEHSEGDPPHVAVLSNPEFLREGRAVRDFMEADRVVIGGEDEWATDILRDVYSPLGAPIVIADRRSSELIKYGSNAFLATKISFINCMAHLCERLGADVVKVAEGMGYDHRIVPEHLRAGLGYGGSCFPKDTAALLNIARRAGYEFNLLEAVVAVNEGQIDWVIAKLVEDLRALSGKTVAVWGLAFKPHTDDTRDSQAVKLVNRLLSLGAIVHAYDPAVKKIANVAGSVRIALDQYDAVRGADALVVATEWPEFVNADFHRTASLMRKPICVDARNCLPWRKITDAGFVYRPLGRSPLDSRRQFSVGDAGREATWTDVRTE